MRKNFASTGKSCTFALAFRGTPDGPRAGAPERLKSVKSCLKFLFCVKSAVTLQTLSGRKPARRRARTDEHIERITIDKEVVRELKETKLESISKERLLLPDKVRARRAPGASKRHPGVGAGPASSAGGRAEDTGNKQQQFVCLIFFGKRKEKR